MTPSSSILTQNPEDFTDDAAMQLSVVETIILILFSTVIIAAVCISVWSGILLALGQTQGGGPLGMLISIWQNI